MEHIIKTMPWYVHHSVGPWWLSLLFLAALAGLAIAWKVTR